MWGWEAKFEKNSLHAKNVMRDAALSAAVEYLQHPTAPSITATRNPSIAMQKNANIARIKSEKGHEKDIFLGIMTFLVNNMRT